MRTFEINLGELHLTRLAYQKQIEKLTQHKEKLLSLAAKLSTMWEGKVATQFIQNMQIFLAVEYNNLLDDYREIAKKLEEAEELFVPLLSLCEGFPDIIKHGNSIGYTISGAAPSPDDILSLDEASGLEINEGIQEYSRQLTKINTLWNQAYSSSSGLSRSSFRLSNYEATFAEGTQRQGKAVSDFFDAFSFNYVPALKKADETIASRLSIIRNSLKDGSIQNHNKNPFKGLEGTLISNNILSVLTPEQLEAVQEIERKMLSCYSTEQLLFLAENGGLLKESLTEIQEEQLQFLSAELVELLSRSQQDNLLFIDGMMENGLTLKESNIIFHHMKNNNGVLADGDLVKLGILEKDIKSTAGMISLLYDGATKRFSLMDMEKGYRDQLQRGRDIWLTTVTYDIVNYAAYGPSNISYNPNSPLDRLEKDKYLSPSQNQQMRENWNEPNPKNPMFGSDWSEYYRGKYGINNVNWKAESFEDLVNNPEKLYGMTKEQVEVLLGDGWTLKTYGSNKSGWEFYDKTGSVVFYHGGGGQAHNGSYYGATNSMSNSITSRQKITGINDGYIPTDDDKAIVYIIEEDGTITTISPK